MAFKGLELDQAGLGLDERYPIAAAAGETGMGILNSLP
jgi:hypothetical protein